MPRPRFNKLSEEKRDLIMRAAAKEFSQNGYENASLNRILEEAGVSKGAAYYYFDDKADVFLTAIDYFMAMVVGNIDFRELARSITDAQSFWPTVEKYYVAQYSRVETNIWMLTIMKAGQRLSAEARTNPALAGAFERGLGWLKDLLGRGQELGVVRTDLPDDLMFALVLNLDSTFDRWMVTHWEEMTVDERRDLLKRIVESLRRFLLPL